VVLRFLVWGFISNSEGFIVNSYIITIQNDMQAQLVFKADTIQGALNQAKMAFCEDMVSGTRQDIHHTIPSLVPKTVKSKRTNIINPPEIKPDKVKHSIDASTIPID
jgi:hypothetical protein